MAVMAATAWFDVVGALGAAVGGLGAAVGAIAAWRSASASRATSRDALDALALAIAPTLVLETFVNPLEGSTDRGNWTARIFNGSAQFAATNVVLEMTFEDGYVVNHRTERIGPSEHYEVILRETEMPPGGPLPEEGGKTAAVRYSDERGIARYEQYYWFVVKGDGSERPTGNVMPASEPQRVS